MAPEQETVAEAFGRQAPVFDKLEEENEILKNMRRRIRDEVLKLLKPGSEILELNAGTGLDAVFFALHGHNITATDVSQGMINEISRKRKTFGLEEQINPQLISFHNLHQLKGRKFNFIFSNFGGLNCTPSLTDIFSNFSHLLLPGGFVCLIIMPPVCPWEISYFLRGNFKMGLRRFNKEGASSHLEGLHFKTWYFSPSEVRKSFPTGFKQVSLCGLGSVMPPPYMENFPKKWPGIFKLLGVLDEKVQSFPLFNRWADHFMIVLQKEN